jgi:putative transposase
MAIPTRATSHGTFFITTQTYDRRRLFQVTATAELLLETLQHYRREGHYKLHAFVIMPDHLHLLLTPTDITLERSIQLIKGGFSHRLASKLPIWQRGFTDRRMRDRDDFLTHRATSTTTRPLPLLPKPRGLSILLGLPKPEHRLLKAAPSPTCEDVRQTTSNPSGILPP